jgi:hypothetical protein
MRRSCCEFGLQPRVTTRTFSLILHLHWEVNTRSSTRKYISFNTKAYYRATVGIFTATTIKIMELRGWVHGNLYTILHGVEYQFCCRVIQYHGQYTSPMGISIRKTNLGSEVLTAAVKKWLQGGVVPWKSTNVSEEYFVSIFRVKAKSQASNQHDSTV